MGRMGASRPTVSGSRMERISACPPSAVLPQVDEIGGQAIGGTWIHKFLEHYRYSGLAVALESVPADYRAACEAIDTALLDTIVGNWQPEVSYAYNWRSGKARRISAPGRSYDVEPDEIPMTLDAVTLIGEDCIGVTDWKSGRIAPAPAARNGQVRLGALAAAREAGRSQAQVMIVRLLGDRIVPDAAQLDDMDLDAVAADTRQTMERVEEAAAMVAAGETPPLRMGEHCRYCPARTRCPARWALVRSCIETPDAIRADVFRQLHGDDRSTAYRAARQIEGIAKDLMSALHAAAADQPIDLGEGVVFGPCAGAEKITDAGVVRKWLEEHQGREVADAACQIEWHSTKGMIESALKSKGMKPADRKVILDGLRAAGAIAVGVTIKEHAVKE